MLGKWHLCPSDEMNMASTKRNWPVGPRLRALLRLPRRRDEPVVSRPRLRQPPGRPAGDARGRLPPHDRPDRQGDRVHQGREDDRAGQAVLHVLLPRRDARAAPRAEGVDREVPRQVRHGLRALPRARLRRARRSWASSRPDAELSPLNPYAEETERRRQAVAGARRGAAVGLAVATTSSRCSAAWPRSTPASSRTPTTRSGGCSTSSRSPASSTTRSSCFVSDNGASGEGGPNGSVNENKFFNGIPDDDRGEPEVHRRARLARRPTTTTRSGWAWAFNTPFKMWKRYNFEGGVADPMIVSWPKGIDGHGRAAPPVPARHRRRARRCTTCSASSCPRSSRATRRSRSRA